MTRTSPDEPPAREILLAHNVPHEPEKPELVRAVGELASENADLCKKVGDLTQALKLDVVSGRTGTGLASRET